MGKMYNECKDIIESCTTGLDNSAIECLTIGFLSLYLLKEDYVLERLPKLLLNTSILRGDSDDVKLSIDLLDEDDESKVVNSLTIPKNINISSYRKVIDGIIFNLIALLRFREVKKNNNALDVYQGISIKHINKDTGFVSTRNKNMELAITSVIASEAHNELIKYLSDEYDDAIPTEHYACLVGSTTKIYNIFAKIIMDFMEDGKFRDLVNASFDRVNGKEFAREYNRIMDNDAAFANLNILFDKLGNAIRNEDEENVSKCITLIYDEMSSFSNKNNHFRKA